VGSTPAFLVCFLSGVPALIYQVVWQRSLSLYFGVDIHATTVSVAVFMLGLGIGSLVGGKASDLLRRPAIAYAVVELLIAALSVTSIYAFPEVGERVAGSRLPIVILVDSCLLLVPTS
jgi:MFS family permease